MKANALIAKSVGLITQRSAIYETEPWGGVEQESFLNQAISVETNLAPEALLVHLKAIEKEVGRLETVVWGPRIIDIDIMLMGDLVHQSEILTIPQQRLENRRFALTPLAEIASDIVHPLLQQTVAQLLDTCSDTTWVKEWAE